MPASSNNQGIRHQAQDQKTMQVSKQYNLNSIKDMYIEKKKRLEFLGFVPVSTSLTSPA